MVVQCQSCQARFRVADEKVTDRGVRVRCTSCKTIFLVRKDGVAEAADQAPTGTTVMGMSPISLVPPARTPGPAPGVRLSSAGPAAAARPSTPPAPARPAVSAPPARAPAMARPAAGPAPAVSRNGTAKRPAPVAEAEGDPFGMAELTGEAPRAAPPPPKPAPRSAPPAAQARPKPPAPIGDELDLGLATPPPSKPVPSRPNVPAPSAASQPPAAQPLGKLARPGKPAPPSRPPPPPSVFDDMEIDDKPAAPPPAAAPSGPPPPPSHDPFAGMDLEQEHGEMAPLRPSDPGLAKVPPASQPLAEAEAPKAEAPPPPAEQPAAVSEEIPEDAPPPRSMRRQIIASALTGVIGAAIAGLLLLGPSAFHEGAALRLLGIGAGDLNAVTEASGLYDTVSGKPVFFVRGRVENRGRKLLGPVRIVALLMGDSGPSARAESVAGVEATPEDVHGIRTTAEAATLMRTLAKKPGERRLPPGASLPFLAIFPDPPADLAGQRIQVRLEPAEATAAR